MWKKKHLGVVAGIIALSLILSGCGAANVSQPSKDQPRTIVVGTSGKTAPYTIRDDEGNLTGQNVELLKAIFKYLPQYKLEFQAVDFKSIMTGIDAGRYQIGANAFSKTPEREKKYLFSDPLYKDQITAVVQEGSPLEKADSFADFAGKTSIGTPGNEVSAAIDTWNRQNPDKAINDTYFENGALLEELRQVENGKADFALLDEPIVKYFEKKENVKIKTISLSDDFLKQVGSAGYGYYLFAKDEPQLVKDVNAAYKKVISSGQATKISNEWFGEDLTVKEGAQ